MTGAIGAMNRPANLRRKLAALVALLAVALLPVLASAAPQGDYQPYVPGSEGAQVNAPLFVIIAYSAIWLVLLVFVLSVFSRQRRVEGELAELRARLGERR